jgi:hypothetical protein
VAEKGEYAYHSKNEEGNEKLPAVAMDDRETEAEPAGDILPPEEEEITGTWPLRSMAS